MITQPLQAGPVCLIEEERLPFYKAEQFYPVHIGDINKYVAVKVLTRTYARSEPAWSRELGVYEHLSRLNSSHVGNAYIRGLYDIFELSNPCGVYRCLVHPAMHLSINTLRMRARSCRLSEPLLKQTLICLLQARDLLHSEVNIVHTGKIPCSWRFLCIYIKASNIMLSIEDEAILTEFEKDEQEHPSWRKIVDKNHVRYASRKLSLPRNDLWGQPVLCDLGEARIGNSHKGNIRPDIYNAPELLFDMPWRSSADIWNLSPVTMRAVLTDMFRSGISENKHLFNALDENKEYPPSHHVAETVAYLGLEETRNVFDQNGGVSIPSISMEESEENLSSQDKQQFLHFMWSMLQWVPEERKTAKELLDDPWLNST
ncbi:hypothetical protein AO1008_00304 [Aspergillus oryzae 100-8]|nr:hypothetical protein AO1008_00304 [Aspergillus oryzae 100-8]